MEAGNEKFTSTPVFSHTQIATRVKELAAEIDAQYGQEPLVAICVLKGAFIFFSDLVRAMHNPNIELAFIQLSSYGKELISSGQVNLLKDVDLDLSGKHVLIVEDIVDSGHTLRFLVDQFAKRKPQSLRIAALVDKKERREANINVDFAGFNLPAGFIVGYGMDYAERYRTLPSIIRLTS